MKPRRGKKCTHCGNIGHEVDNFWVKQASGIKSVSFATIEAMTGYEKNKEEDTKRTSENVGIVMEQTLDEVVTAIKRTTDGKHYQNRQEPSKKSSRSRNF